MIVHQWFDGRSPTSMQAPRSQEMSCSRGRSGAEAGPPALRPLLQLGRILALPVLALASGALQIISRQTPDVRGAVARNEAGAIRRRLRNRLQELRATGASFELSDVVHFPWRRVGIFGPMEDIRVYFPAADRRIALLLQTRDVHVVVVERAPDALTYLIFRPSDEIPSANRVCLESTHIVVSRVSRDCVDYLDFAVAPPTASS